MTANPEPMLYDITVCSAKTLDMTFPVVNVGRCPDSSEPTLVGPCAPDRLPYVRPVAVLPPLDTATEDDLSDLAANASGDTHNSADDLYALCGSALHVRAICEQLGRREMQLDSRDAKIDRLENNVRILAQQLAVSKNLGDEMARRFERSDAALAHTAHELYAERNRVVELEVLLRAERQRLEREATMHHETMNRLEMEGKK